MGSKGNSTQTEERFEYKRSEDIKEWSQAEQKRTAEMSRFVIEKTFETGDYNEFYEENTVEELEKAVIPASDRPAEEVSITKMNLVYTQSRDEEGRRVKQGKAVTGSTYYLVQTDNGSINETNFAYKTKADAQHAMRLYIDEETQRRAYYARRRS